MREKRIKATRVCGTGKRDTRAARATNEMGKRKRNVTPRQGVDTEQASMII